MIIKSMMSSGMQVHWMLQFLEPGALSDHQPHVAGLSGCASTNGLHIGSKTPVYNFTQWPECTATCAGPEPPVFDQDSFVDKHLRQFCTRLDARIIFQSPPSTNRLPPEGTWERWPVPSCCSRHVAFAHER